MRSCFLSLTIAVAAILPAASAQEANLLELMNEAVSGTPVLAIAESDMARANAARDRLELGPCTSELSATGGSRSVNEPVLGRVEYSEWSATAARTFRFPAKTAQDRRLGTAEIEVAKADKRLNLVEERLTFARLWSQWAQAHEVSKISAQLAEGAKRLADLEDKKVLAGAGRRIDANQASLEAMQFQLIAERDAGSVRNARDAIQVRYPNLTLPLSPDTVSVEAFAAPVPSSTMITPGEDAARARAERALLSADRVRLDALPDPTFSVGFANDFGGRETALVFGVSIPFGGSVQQSRYNEAAQEANLAKRLAERARWEDAQALRNLEASIETYRQLVAGAETSVEIANATLDQFEAGYALGEVVIRDLLMARRSALDSQQVLNEYMSARDRAQLEYTILLLP